MNKRSQNFLIDNFPYAPPKPPQWDTLLHSLNITEPEALKMVQTRTGVSSVSSTLRNWIQCNYKLVFVPELFLKTMGIETGFDNN